MMIIKLKQIRELMSGGYHQQSIRINSNHIQYYHEDILQIPCEPDIPVTRIVTLSFDDILVTQTLEEIDLILNEDKRVVSELIRALEKVEQW